MKRILIGCEESQAVCKAFRARGFEAYSCDIQPCSGGHPEWHIQEDVLKVIHQEKWDLGIFFPPCTYLTVSGARWMYLKDGSINLDRKCKQEDAIEFVKAIYYSPIEKLAIENPIGVLSSIWMKPTQIIQPYYFGDEAQKTTCLWLKNLPLLYHNSKPNIFDPVKTHVGKGETITTSTGKTFTSWYWNTSYCKGPERLKERAKLRSKTFPGIANAMAEQWGNYLLEKQAA